MRFRVRHRSSYAYQRQVQLSYHALHLLPRAFAAQRVLGASISADPAPSLMGELVDHFGNTLSLLTLTEPHARLTVDLDATVEVCFPAPPEQTRPWERVRDAVRQPIPGAELARAAEFAYPSPLAQADAAVADYAARSFPPGRPVLEAARDLTRRIHADFRFDPDATSVGTSCAEVMRLGRGVCQDFAHLQLAGMRALGLPVRYVSGYIRNDRPGADLAFPDAQAHGPFVGADASHAWVSVFCHDEGEGSGVWVDLDPTNDLVVRESHVVLGWGRDYRDVSPISGILVGGGAHALEVEVAVRTLA